MMNSVEMKLFILLVPILCQSLASQCPIPGLPSNGFAKVRPTEMFHKNPWHTYWPGEAVEYQCNPGWKIPENQNASIKCQEDATWSGPAPRCDLIVDELVVGKPYKRDVIGKLQERKWDRFQCTSYTYTHLRFTVTSIGREMFKSGLRIVDVRVELCPSSRQGITVTLHSASHRVMCISSSKQESIEIFNCQEAVLETTPESYLQIGFTSLSRVRSVQISARDENQCGIPAAPAHGRVQPVTNLTVAFQCGAGYWLSGNAVATCDPLHGIWTPTPICSPYTQLLLIGLIGGLSTFTILVAAIVFVMKRKALCSWCKVSTRLHTVDFSPPTELKQNSERPAIMENIYENVVDLVYETVTRPSVHPAPRPPSKIPPMINDLFV